MAVYFKVKKSEGLNESADKVKQPETTSAYHGRRKVKNRIFIYHGKPGRILIVATVNIRNETFRIPH